MTFEEKAQVEIIKMAMNPKKRSSLIGGFDEYHGKLVYTDNGFQIFTIDKDAIYIDIDKCFPEKNERMIEMFFEKETCTVLAVPTLQLRQMKNGRVAEEFQTVEGLPRSMWTDRKLLARFEQPGAYAMGSHILYLENELGFRYGAIMEVSI